MDLTPDRFRALARSSRQRWRTLRFTVTWRDSAADAADAADPVGASHTSAVRAWLRRPDALRVEGIDGRVLQAGIDPDPDGDPMYQTYHWVAMLDPVELADGVGEDTPRDPAVAPVWISRLTEVTAHGRTAWQADLLPTAAYDPRCSCCPLLFSEVSENWEAEAGGPVLRERDPGLRYADAHRVRLDAATGVCVYTEELGGSHAGAGHEVVIHAVDEPMPDSLFTARRR
ncbi:hypothetical protein [Prauserella muralis]|uniref:Uncharacterized protein n=1 Tax=Prauserella muralis TaxID=588067 RepID=A0A2V4BB79_9PSEU|nr:hypothetical protein [Prauserella muralis]PXY32635.1 hypothetical protein BAY60_01080 [Prauserella muralis]